MELEEDNMVLNNVTKFYKILIKNIRVRERTLFQMVKFHKERAITLESLVQIWTITELEEDIMVLNNVTKFHKILIKNIRVRVRTSFQMVKFHKERAITLESQVQIWTIIELKEDIMVLNNVTKFHKILTKNIRVRERTSIQMVNFHKQRAITLESLVQYGPFSNLKKNIMVLNNVTNI